MTNALAPVRNMHRKKLKNMTSQSPRSIRLPISLIEKINDEAARQHRTPASLIRQVLAEKFEQALR